MKKYLYICLGVILSGCTNSFVETEKTYPISLSANITGMESMSRSTMLVTGSSMAGNTAAVFFSLDSNVYKHDPQEPHFLPFRTTSLTYLEGATTIYSSTNMTNPLTYPLDGEKQTVYCVGLHPDSGWNIADDYKSASRTIDGKTDLMFAKRISGTWQTPLPKQTYRHLLTWIRVTIRAMDMETATYWGKVNSIQLVNPYNQFSIILESGSVVPGVDTNRLEIVTQTLPLDVVFQDIGSKLCAPATSYQLIVRTERQEKTITVKLKNLDGTDFTGDASGKQFIINLYFYPFNSIEAESFLVPWNEQNEDLELQ